MSDDRFAQPSDAAPDDVTIPGVDDERHPALDPPAPIIDLGGEASQGPSRPLGPRRLALLREQMAKHQQEIEQAGSGSPEEVDPVLAQKQRRMAELASRAAISSEEDHQLADEAIAQTQSIQPITDEYLAARDAEASADEPAPEGSVDDEPAPDDELPSDELPSDDPEQPGSAAVAESTPWSDPVPVVPAAQLPEEEQRAQDAPLPQEEAAPEAPLGQADDAGEPSPEETAPADLTEPTDPAEPAEPTDSAEKVEPAESVRAVEPADDEQEPSAPVRAVNAQGLQLMEPKDYRRGVDWRTPALTLAALLVVALVAVLIFFVL